MASMVQVTLSFVIIDCGGNKCDLTLISTTCIVSNNGLTLNNPGPCALPVNLPNLNINALS